MAKIQLFIFLIIGVFAPIFSTIFASLPEIKHYSSENQPYITGITDTQLKELAIQKEILPKDYDLEQVKEHIKINNTIPAWVILSREKKLEMINRLKARLKKEKGIIITKSAEFYVDEINSLIYNNIANGTVTKDKTSAVGYAFSFLAMISGDYDNGKSRVETLRNYIGEEEFRRFVESFPNSYENLVILDKKNSR